MMDELFGDLAELVDISRTESDEDGNPVNKVVAEKVPIAILPDRTPRVNSEGYLLEDAYYDAIISPPIIELRDNDEIYRDPRTTENERGATPVEESDSTNYRQVLTVVRNEIFEDIQRLDLEDKTKVQ